MSSGKNCSEEVELEEDVYVGEDNEASQDQELDATPPAPSPPSASPGDDPTMNDQNRLFTSEEEEIIHWMEQHLIVYYHFSNWKAGNIKAEVINDKSDEMGCLYVLLHNCINTLWICYIKLIKDNCGNYNVSLLIL